MSSSPPPEPYVSRVVRVGAAVGAGSVAALVASLPAALRVAAAPDAHTGTVGIWFALAASSLAPSVLGVVLFRAARRGLAAFGGPGAATRALAFFAWLFAAVDVLFVLGALLRATTHHHALAGATFALGGLTMLVGVGAVLRRVVALAAAWPARAHAVLGLAAGALGVVPLVVALHVGRASPATGLLVDTLAFFIALAFLSRPSFGRRRALGLVGPPLAVLVAVLGFSTLRSAPLGPAVDASAPLLALPVDATTRLMGGR